MTGLCKQVRKTCGTILLLAFAHAAFAHSTGENYVFLNIDEDALHVRVELHQNELDSKFGLQLQDEVPDAAALQPVVAYVGEHLEISAFDQPLQLDFRDAGRMTLPQGEFLHLHFAAEWAGALPESLIIRQTLFFEQDPRHRGLLLIERNAVAGRDFGEEYTALIFRPDNAVQELDLVDVPGLLQLREFLWQGAWHILIGYDHILFLLSLLLTSVVFWQAGRWVPEESFRNPLLKVAGIVTVFTVAHSISLSLAALDIVKLPSRPVEIVIALSIIVMAMDNLRPYLPKRWVVIFLFGLFHGLGFATVMGHLTFRMVDLVKVMVLFNLGVELGQLAIVLAVFPLLYLLRKKSWFVPVVIQGGSVAISVVAAYWLVERVIG
ncbi:MAG: HupE/UreJ family protein [Woeseiaceae bacterium]|nr:HupE/UreJ family protein [Woeseiaceae bacterium]